MWNDFVEAALFFFGPIILWNLVFLVALSIFIALIIPILEFLRLSFTREKD